MDTKQRANLHKNKLNNRQQIVLNKKSQQKKIKQIKQSAWQTTVGNAYTHTRKNWQICQ